VSRAKVILPKNVGWTHDKEKYQGERGNNKIRTNVNGLPLKGRRGNKK